MVGTGTPIVTFHRGTSSYPIPSLSPNPTVPHRPQRFEAYTPSSHSHNDKDDDDVNDDERGNEDGSGVKGRKRDGIIYSNSKNVSVSKRIVPICTSMCSPVSDRHTDGVDDNDDGGDNDRKEGEKDDGIYDPITCVSIDPNNHYSALLTVHYYDIVEKKTTDNPVDTIVSSRCVTTTVRTMAEVNVSISPLGKGFGSVDSGRTVAEYTHVPLFESCSTTSARYHVRSEEEEEKQKEDGNVTDGGWNLVHKSQLESPKSNIGNDDDTPTPHNRQYHWPNITLNVVFASDGKHLACLIPCPTPHHTTQTQTQTHNPHNATITTTPPPKSKLIIFTLRQRYRRTKGDTVRIPPPFPHYIQPTCTPDDDDAKNPRTSYRRQHSSDDGNGMGGNTGSSRGDGRGVNPLLPPLILDARILSSGESPSIDADPSSSSSSSSVLSVGRYLSTQISCICNVTVPPKEGGKRKNTYSVLIGGCTDGSILLLGYRKATLIDVPYRPETNGEDGDITSKGMTGIAIGRNGGGIRSLVHRTDGGDGRSKGRLIAVYDNGTARIFSTEFGVGGFSSLSDNNHHCASSDQSGGGGGGGDGGGSGEYGLQVVGLSASSTSVSVEDDYRRISGDGDGGVGGIGNSGSTEDELLSAVADTVGTGAVRDQRQNGEHQPLLEKEDDEDRSSVLLNGEHSTKLTNGTTNHDTKTNTTSPPIQNNATTTKTKTKTIPPSSPKPNRWIVRSSNRLRITITPHRNILPTTPTTTNGATNYALPPFARALFIDYYRLAFLVDPLQEYLRRREFRRRQDGIGSEGGDGECGHDDGGEPIVAMVWHIGDDREDDGGGQVDNRLLATLRMTPDKLKELSHGSFTSDTTTPSSSTSSSTSSEEYAGDQNITSTGGLSIHCDHTTTCLAISTAIAYRTPNHYHPTTTTIHQSASIQQPPDLLSLRTFVTLWDWRTPASGFTLMDDTTTECTMRIVDGGLIESRCGGGSDDLQRRQQYRQTTGVVSSLYFCDNGNGRGGGGGGNRFGLVHLRKTKGGRGSRRLCVKKDLYSWGVLSPSQVVEDYTCGDGMEDVLRKRCRFRFERPTPLLMMHDSISFPFVMAPTSCKDFTIQWKESNIPTTYTSLNGPILTSTIGTTHGRSIAVAALRGLCILDLSSRNQQLENQQKVRTDVGPSIVPTPCIAGTRCNKGNDDDGVKSNTAKWRMFREVEERSFAVRAMTWWERGNGVSEDLLLAVVQYTTHVDGLPAYHRVESNDGQHYHRNAHCYLVCWSRRRLGSGSLQLLQEASSSRYEDKNDIHRLGIPLKKGFMPSSISLIPEPPPHNESCRNDSIDKQNDDKHDRALLLLGSQPTSGHGINYLIYQLQTVSKLTDDRQQRPRSATEEAISAETGTDNVVIGNLCSYGLIDEALLRRFSSSKAISPCGIFIAGGSFRFHLVQNGCNDIPGSNDMKYITTLGVICTIGRTMFSVTVTPIGPISCACIYESDSNSKMICPTVQRYWIADIVVVKSDENLCQFIWTITKSDGCNLTWSVPFLQHRTIQDDNNSPVEVSTNHYNGGKDMKVKTILLDVLSTITENTPSHDPSARTVQRKNRDLQGAVLHDGDFLRGCVNDQSEILLGPMPSIYCNFVFHVGQASRNLQAIEGKSSNIQLYGLTDCIVGPPTFLASLLIDLSEDHAFHHRHSMHIIQKYKYFDTAMVTLRTIITCLTVFISSAMDESNEVGVVGNEGNGVMQLVKNVLLRALTFARGSMSEIHFATLFLSAGRQLEPHQCNHLFPLILLTKAPLPSFTTDLEDNNGGMTLSITVQDLYSSAVAAGSLTIAASALPLLAIKDFTYKQCKLLLHHSISAILRLCALDGKQCISCIREECLFFRQLYLYGLKLEESTSALEVNEDRTTFDEGSTIDDLDLSEEDSSYTENSNHTSCSTSVSVCKDQDDVYFSTQKTSGSPNRVLQLASTLFSPIKVYNDMKKEKQSETAISEAASSFIFSEYYNDIHEIEGRPCTSGDSENTEKSALIVNDNETQRSMIFQGNRVSIAETIGFAIVSSMFFPSANETSSSRLNKVAMLCLLLQSDNLGQTPVNTSVCVSNLLKSLTIDSFHTSLEYLCHLQVLYGNEEYLFGDDALSSVESLTTSVMCLCLDHWDDDIAGVVFQTIISLLTQNSTGRLSEIMPLLTLVALSAGHICRKAETLFGFDSAGTSTLQTLYDQCIEKL